MKAIIMAGGKGRRLAPYTAVLPKPLMPLDDIPILELILRQLKFFGISEVILAVNHLNHLIKAFFGTGETLGMDISYSYEEKPLGTAGPVGAAIDKLSDHFLLLNGDLLCNINYRELIQAHLAMNAQATIATYLREIKNDFGVLTIDENHNLTGYQEKPTHRYRVSMGLYVLCKEAVYEHIKPNVYLDMPTLMQYMIQYRQKVYCHDVNGIWLDIGRPEDYAKAQKLFSTQREIFLPLNQK